MNRTQNNTKTHKGSVLGKFRLLGELVIKISIFRTTEFIGSFASGPQNLSLRLPHPLVSHLLQPSLTQAIHVLGASSWDTCISASGAAVA